ncbi:NF-kappa-B inhibitor zeta isoform X1 [Entelurus aequoreus]|uniref:NF-kappa-B inhibitor zeta isoform X1 n=1 Tax=Entelurus aequoreus TaxID=161455 RepID=UPI002B1DF57D|nr:NF-kappa-B inhibitor zeta isoform X1 [Entelurus aequoreus]
MSHQLRQKRKHEDSFNTEDWGTFTPDMSPYVSSPCLQSPPAPKSPMTLFHWQIQQESQRFEGVSPEVLTRQDVDGDTCLHIAVAQGRRALAHVLAAKMAGCDALEMKEHRGQTALHVAAAADQHLIVQDLLLHGAHINARDSWGRSPLHVCAEKGFYLSLQSICRTLSGCGQWIDTEMFNYDGQTPLHVAVLSHNAAEAELRALDHTRAHLQGELLQRKHVYAQCVETLLNMGASCGTKDLKSGRTCLHMAALEANIQLLDIILQQPLAASSVNMKTFSGNTALHIVSALRNHPTQLRALAMLMRAGADPGVRNMDNEAACQLVPAGDTGEKVCQMLRGQHVPT